MQQQDSLESLDIQGLLEHPKGLCLGNCAQLQTLGTSLDLLFGTVGQVNDSTSVAEGPHLSFDIGSLLPLCLQQLTVRHCMTGDLVIIHRSEALEALLDKNQRRLPSLVQSCVVEEKLEGERTTIPEELMRDVQHRLSLTLPCLISDGVDVKNEAKELEAGPYSPRLRNVMGDLGHPKYRQERW